MSKHGWTPGEWVFDFNAETGTAEVTAPKAPKTHRRVARCAGAKYRVANAHLMAAAPDLYEACVDLLQWHEDLADPQWDNSPTQKKAVAALKKARGMSE